MSEVGAVSDIDGLINKDMARKSINKLDGKITGTSGSKSQIIKWVGEPTINMIANLIFFRLKPV